MPASTQKQIPVLLLDDVVRGVIAGLPENYPFFLSEAAYSKPECIFAIIYHHYTLISAHHSMAFLLGLIPAKELQRFSEGFPDFMVMVFVRALEYAEMLPLECLRAKGVPLKQKHVDASICKVSGIWSVETGLKQVRFLYPCLDFSKVKTK